MFPVKEVGEMSKILLSYTDHYIVDKNFDIKLETDADSIGICRAYINDLRPFQGYNDFLIDAGIAKDLRDIKVKTVKETRDDYDNIIISGATALTPDAKSYREINVKIIRGGKMFYGGGDRGSFLTEVWSKVASINYTTVPEKALIGSNKFLEIPVYDNDDGHETLLISTSEFYFGKTFRDMSAGLVDNFHSYQYKHPEKRFVIVRMRYEELNLYMLVAIAV